MKQIQYIILLAICTILASCMGQDYAEANYDEVPYGNNAISETNVVSIQQLKELFSEEIATSYAYRQVTEDLQIKGIVTSSDAEGNIYNELALQDSTGAIIISIAQGGLYSFLPAGTEILVDLKGLYVGNYGLQAEIGVPTMNSRGQTSVGRMSRATWDNHFKILGKKDVPEPELFADGSNKTTWDLTKDGGKLGIIKNVSFRFWSVDSTYANSNGGAGSIEWQLNEQDASVIVYNSNYSDFANTKVPTGKVNITGIFKRYNNKWEIIIRSIDDVEVLPEAVFQESFGDGTLGDFTVENIILPEGLDYVWAGSTSYGAKASAYVNGVYYAVHSRIVSPAINMKDAKLNLLTFDQAGRFFTDVKKECRVLVSTDKTTWSELPLSTYLDGSSWDFVTTTCDLSSYAGKTIYIAFDYQSTDQSAATWEIKNVKVE